MTRNASDAPVSGTQSIERAIVLVREISARGDFGWKLSELADRCRLGRSTTHRILVCLVRQRLVRQRPSDRHYMPGPMLYELGLSVQGYGELQHNARVLLGALAKRTGAIAFMSFRSGDEFVCAVRVGNAESKVFSGFPGSRKPLIGSVGGIAIMMHLPESENRGIFRRNLTILTGYTKNRIREARLMLKRSKAERFAINEGNIVAGVNSYGLALFDASNQPFASIALAAGERTLPIKRLPEIKKLLQATSAELQALSPLPDVRD